MAELFEVFQSAPQRQTYVGTEDINISGIFTPGSKDGTKAATPVPFEAQQPSPSAQTQVKPVAANTPPLELPAAQSKAEAGLLSSTQDLVAETKKGNEFEEAKESSRISGENFLAGARFALDVHNANSAYNAVALNARFQIQDARNSAWDAIERGRQRALEAKAEGQFASDDALLSLAAQGQDVSGVGAQKVVGSLEDIAGQNALQEEFDSFREALGFDLEEVAINYQVDQANIQRTNTILSSGLNFGATAIGNTL